MALSGHSSGARSDRVRPREELVVCLGVAFAPVSSSWQAVVGAYLAAPAALGWDPYWCFDHQSRLALAGAHEIVIEGVVQQESGNLCHTGRDMSKALTRLVVARLPFACANSLKLICADEAHSESRGCSASVSADSATLRSGAPMCPLSSAVCVCQIWASREHFKEGDLVLESKPQFEQEVERLKAVQRQLLVELSDARRRGDTYQIRSIEADLELRLLRAASGCGSTCLSCVLLRRRLA